MTNKYEITPTQQIIEKFEEVCEEFANDDVDAKLLKKEINNIIDNYSN